MLCAYRSREAANTNFGAWTYSNNDSNDAVVVLDDKYKGDFQMANVVALC